MKHLLWIVPTFLMAALLGFGLALWVTPDAPITETASVTEQQVQDDTTQETTETSETDSLFVLHDELVADWASNPLVIEFDGTTLTLAYESRSDELKFAPQDKVKLVQTTDGVHFEEIENELGGVPKPLGIQLPDGTWKRYTFMPDKGGVFSLSSEDGTEYTEDDVMVYEAHADGPSDAREFGVYTYFVDDEGGVVLLFNETDENDDIVVSKLYAEPESNGLEFELVERDILDGTLESERYADPAAITLSDGRIMLIVMNQNGPVPPLGRVGTIHAYMSDDYGETFDYYGQLLSYEDISFATAYSLNDPKIVEFDDGTIRLYVAVMIPDEEAEETEEVVDGKATGFKWVLVGASSQ